MAQSEVWEKEYRQPRLVTGGAEPQNDFKRFVKWLKKNQKKALTGLTVLDLGAGLGKNSIFMAERGSTVTGLEISDTAIKTAKERAQEKSLEEPDVTFLKHDIGTIYPFKDRSFDVVLDVISSNSLNEAGREVYLKEISRVLKPGGCLFVRALCKEGDKHAEFLVTNHPGPEPDTYIMPGLKLTERVFTKEDFINTYSEHFTILELTKKSGYAQFAGKTYKRNYWLAYMIKPSN